jgi:hypothetical protein
MKEIILCNLPFVNTPIYYTLFIIILELQVHYADKSQFFLHDRHTILIFILLVLSCRE